MCDDGRHGYHIANSGERITQPLVKSEGRFRPAPWARVSPILKETLASATGLVAVLSPVVTVEEAFLFAKAFQQVNAKLVLGPVPVVGEDDKYPKDVKGNSVEPVKFTIRAEKCPNRKGVEQILTRFQGSVIPFSDVVNSQPKTMWFVGGYPVKEHLEAAFPANWKAPETLIAQDLFPTLLTASAKIVLPATASFEKDGTFVNHAGYTQTFTRATRPPVEVRTELQLAYDLLGRKGLVRADTVLAEMEADGIRLGN
jgi:NADH-quinone oxidoreductase subunit G